MNILIIISLVLVVLWVLLIITLLMPHRAIPNLWDRLTRAKWRQDRIGLTIMLDHLKSRPEEWSISSTHASFPKEGAKQIHIEFDKNSWSYNLNSFGSNFRPLEGYFGSEFSKAINAENSRRESASLLRNFYPELDGRKLLK